MREEDIEIEYAGVDLLISSGVLAVGNSRLSFKKATGIYC